MKKEKNVITGLYLIEHQPGEDQPYQIYDLRVLFSNQHSSFNCSTRKEANELVARLGTMSKHDLPK